MKFPDASRAWQALASDSASLKPLAALRIGLAAILLGQLLVLWEYRDLLLGEFGLVPWVIGDAMTDPLLPKLSHVASWLAPLGIDSRSVVGIVLLAHGAGAAFLLLGYKTRAAALVAWATYLPLKNSGFLFTYGLGALLLIGLFYCIFMPVGRQWSLDRRLASPDAPDPQGSGTGASLSILVLRIHLCIIYGAAGISKAFGEQWWSGDAVWRALSLPQFQQFDPAPILAYPLLLQVAAVGAVIVQVAYPVLVWTRLRALVVVLTELLHLGIAIALGLWLFSAVMIVFNAAAFGETLWKAARSRLGIAALDSPWRPRWR